MMQYSREPLAKALPSLEKGSASEKTLTQFTHAAHACMAQIWSIFKREVTFKYDLLFLGLKIK